ncbi:hypothetical protein [Candidatus Enterococcus clewellii]|uniref:Uncharacterized protein n=1 Tax=Candidatus Enterococcus clewellii TaxID=1834193 RepID=A0A242KDM8_9ENTE|nr:hypothetical protein [Enterococcus sp. 9E7_DIV0242]OTP19066.1 hypothetical protein A5888_000880 [Enterococcus sp. 9E7_DIV0242]
MKEKRSFELFNEHELIEPVTPETIATAFEGLDAGKFHILILEATPMLEDSPFIQLARGEGVYIVEIQFDRGGTLQQFRKETDDIEVCQKLFLDYFSGILPDREGWRDVTAEIIYYFDDREDEGVAKETSHPFFVNHFINDLYYDSTDDYAPFGNDTGNDTLYMLERKLIEDDELEDFDSLPMFISKSWGLDYMDPLKTVTDASFISENEVDIFESSQITIAVGFGLIKITGGISSLLKQRTLAALEQLLNLLPDGKEAYQRQIEDLKSFNAYDE